ncbi:lipid A export permease/ATP-binding protein MsbA [Marinicella gelatinilytica]|uniref:lipid A export permease/ATP-binding protein MsbA n=1 Tax=Marinicella gelatinilytica TaxID=2996017 RepID=UPI002260E11F|nr:lipid A export permease/ATP-binding protein MsbA [Marinicella gelatinilytica]MCX7544749.1 lipid A export permease/ATP-binding protein MsbA [Marinicella gelatinilytica]
MIEADSAVTYRGLLRYVKPYRLVFFLALLGAVIDAAMKALFLWMLSPILEQGFNNQDPQWVFWIPFFVIGIFFIRSIGNFMSAYGFTWVGRQIINDLRQQIFAQYLRLPQSFYDRHTTGGLLSRLIYDIEQMANGVSKNFVIIIREFLSIVFYLLVMFYYSWTLALVAFVVFPLIGAVVYLINKRFRRIGHGIQDSVSDLSSTAEEVIRGHKIVKIFHGEDQEQAKFKHNLKTNRQLQVKIAATKEVLSTITLMSVAVALAVIMYIAAKTGMPAADFMSFMSTMLVLLPTVKNLSTVFATIQTTMAAADSVQQIVSAKPEQDKGIEQLSSKQIDIKFKDVTFAYNHEATALENINLHIKPGDKVAFVGASGGGKTSLVNLVPRFYEVSSGKLLINNQPVEHFTLASLRDHLAVVSQEIILFNDTVKNNIAYGALRNHSDEDIVEAARKAHALEFIQQLPQGFNTVLGENGTGLSGGQRQRIAIARAILKNAPLLILDEATSALDTESEQAIQKALKTVMQDKTTLIIAHRLSTIEDVDYVVVLDQGHIVQQGSHESLSQQTGPYRQLLDSQQLQQ